MKRTKQQIELDIRLVLDNEMDKLQYRIDAHLGPELWNPNLLRLFKLQDELFNLKPATKPPKKEVTDDKAH